MAILWTAKQIAKMSDDLLVEELLVALALGLDASPLTRAVIRRGLVDKAAARAIEKTTDNVRRLG